MKKQKAIKVLVSHRKEIIRDVYDSRDDISEAILTLRPDFEYPEWDWKSIGEF